MPASDEECRKQMKEYFENAGWSGTLTGCDIPPISEPPDANLTELRASLMFFNPMLPGVAPWTPERPVDAEPDAPAEPPPSGYMSRPKML